MSFPANASSGLGLNTQSPGFSEREGHSPSSVPEGITIISFDVGDPENPVSWSTRRKNFVVFLGIVAIINSTLDSSLPSGAIDYIADEFHVRNKVQLVLPISLYLIGYVLGPLFFGPLSETFGRRIVMVPTFALFTIFTLACAAAPNWCAFLIFRFICGVGASSAIAVTGGMYADIYCDLRARGRAIALFISATAFGPQFAPIISGFVSPAYDWRWTFWIGFIIAGISFIPVLFLQETYGLVILLKRAQKMRKESSGCKVYAAIELENKGIEQMVTITLARPLRMLFTEPIVLFSCLYLSMATAIFFLFFEAYPLIFQGIYGMSTGVAGMAFLPIAVGACVAFGISLWYDSIQFFRVHRLETHLGSRSKNIDDFL